MPYDAVYFLTLSMAVLASIAISSPLARSLHLPRGLVLMAIGLAGSEWMSAQGTDSGIRAEDFRELVIYLFLPALIFGASMRIDISRFTENIAAAFTLSVPMLLIAGLAASTTIYFLVNDPQTLPWIAALLASVLVMPTDSVAAATVREYLRLPERARITIESESLLNNPMVLVLFAFLLGIVSVEHTGSFYTEAAFNLLLMLLGGSALGVLFAIPVCMLFGKLQDANARAALTLACAYGAYMLAGFKSIEVSGIMAVLVCGVIINSSIRNKNPEEPMSDLAKTWSLIGAGFGSAIYLLAGITMSLALFSEQWVAVLAGIAAAVVARAITAYGGFLLLNRTRYKASPADFSEQHAVALGGTRGVITVAIALSLPPDLPYTGTLQAIAYSVAIFTLLTQTGALAIFAKKFPPPPNEQGALPD